MTVSELASYNQVHRITDADTLSLDVKLNFGMMFYMYVLPEGTTGDTVFSDLDEDDVLVIMVLKASYIFDISVGKESYYATIFASMMSRQYICEDNSSSNEKNGYGSYTSLVYYIGSSEQEKISSNGKYALTINSGFDLSNDILYTGSSKEMHVDVDSNNQITLFVQTSSGKKYVEFYYDLSEQNLGSATVRLYLEDEETKSPVFVKI